MVVLDILKFSLRGLCLFISLPPMVKELLSYPHQHFILSTFIDNLLVKFFIILACISITASEIVFVCVYCIHTDTQSYVDCNLNPPKTTHPASFYFLYFMEKKPGFRSIMWLASGVLVWFCLRSLLQGLS